MVCTLIAAIRTLLPNLNGPTDSVRKLYCGVWELVVLYATPILSGHGTFNEYRRTIRKETHSRCWDCVAEGDDAEHTLLSCPRWINERTLLENYVGEILTINNVIDLVVSSEENWILSGHGTFNEYRRTIRKETHSRCWDCVAEGDDAEHTLLSCPRWINERTLLENYVGEILTINNVIDLVVSSEENWVRFQGICRKIMIARQDQERNMKKRKRR
ncbi:uncharacterized protein LOC105681339 [Bombus impatiens]|uniref:Uncharacterized protein LOC105681339 n=1 Tax=Bombus impatiens TaxID=132113 RepID=A0A6P6FFD4_BOMIM|nr:uncharacterized protein LOC105681339 [Bombus impatiens]